MRKLLITSFDAFGQDSLNASFELMKKLPNKVGNILITKLQIPTVRYESFNKIKKIHEQEKFDFIIALGQAANTDQIRLEKIGINLDDFKIKDNKGNQPIDEKIIEDGENAYFSDLPLKTILNKLHQNGIPSCISYSAGTFVCNHVLYSMLYNYKKNVGFIHVPKIKDAQTIGLPLEIMVKAVIIVIESLELEESKFIGGTIQ